MPRVSERNTFFSRRIVIVISQNHSLKIIYESIFNDNFQSYLITTVVLQGNCITLMQSSKVFSWLLSKLTLENSLKCNKLYILKDNLVDLL